MALTLIPPGGRKGNKHFIIRGSYKNVVYEKATGTSDPKLARACLREFKAGLERREPQPGDKITFADAARRYVEFRNPSREDRKRIDRVIESLGRSRLLDIRSGDLHEAAVRMLPDAQAATRNREFLRPASTVLHYAATAGLCDYIRVKSFPEPRPQIRALDPAAAAALIEAAETEDQRRLLTWLFFQGTRITATLRLTWDQIDLGRRVVLMWNDKGKRWEEFPLHEATIAALGEPGIGPIFAWSNKSSLRRWLPRLCEKVGVHFTAHMARHTLGTQLAASGASLATIMKALGHSQASSSLRYQSPDIEVVRAATAKISYVPQGSKPGFKVVSN